MSYKTKTGVEVTGEIDEFLFFLSLVATVRMSTTKQNSSISMVTSSPVFVFVLSKSHLNCVDSFTGHKFGCALCTCLQILLLFV